MKNVIVAKRYAKAIYELALETNSVDDVQTGFSNIHTALKNVPQLEKVLFNPIIKPEEKQKMVKTVTSNKLILKFVGLLAKRKRLDLLSAVFDHFQYLTDQYNDVNRVLVKTAVSLSDSQKKLIEKGIAKRWGGSVVGHYQVAKELIGGVWIKMGDKVLDSSLKGKFDDLRFTLNNSTN